MNRKILYAGGGLVLAAAIGGGVALAVQESRKRKAKKTTKAAAPAQKAADVTAAAAPTKTTVEATSLPTMMTDDQAATWAGNYPILMDSADMHAVIAASTVLLPLMNLGLTAGQVKKYNVAPPNDTARKIITARQQDVVVPGVTMTDDQAMAYAANLKLYNSNSTSQTERNSAVRALAPIVGLRETGYQISQFGGGPPDPIRNLVAADYATLQSTGNAPM